jgi:hypothetical protein
MCRKVPCTVRGRPRQRNGGAIRKRLPARATPLDEVILHLRHVHSAVVVAVAALRRQNCELDEDIASLLQRCVCDRIDDQLEKLEAARARARRLIPL